MNRKEWREVSRQSLYFVLAVAGMVLLTGLAGLLDGEPLGGEKIIIILGLWLLMFSMFIGLSPFALDSNQKGMEYLLTLPYSRRRLLFIKFLPRLASVVLFYFAFAFLYGLLGNNAFVGGFTIFSLTYFTLFLISFSLSLVHENFIVQSIWAGIALCGYLALCLYVVSLGFCWKFNMPSSWIGSSFWNDLSYDVSTLISSIAVFLLLALPFVVSYFLAFKKFDLKPSRMFNRRQLLIFVPLLVLAFAASLGVTYLMQKGSAYGDSDFYILKDQRLLKTGFPGKLTLYDEASRRKVDTRSRVYWERLLLEKADNLYLSGYDTKDGSRIIGVLNQADLSWKILHRAPERFFVANGYLAICYDGRDFIYLRRSRTEAMHPGMGNGQAVKSEVLELVRVDPVNGQTGAITFRSPLFRKYYQPFFIGSDERHGLHFWLVALQWQNVLRLWEDGRVEDLGLSKAIPTYAGGLLFIRGDHCLKIQRLLDAGSETIKEIAGDFGLGNVFRLFPLNKQAGEIYATRDKRIVRINLTTLAVDDVGPMRGHITMVPPGIFYYVEYDNWPGLPTGKWRKLYQLQGGRMVFLKQFDFNAAGYGHIFVEESGFTTFQRKDEKTRTRFYAFPDLRELKFKKLN